MVGAHRKGFNSTTKNRICIIKNSITLRPFLLPLHLSQDSTVNVSSTSQHDLSALPSRQDIVWWKVYDEDYEARHHARRGRSRYFEDDYFGPRPRFPRHDGHPRYRFRYRRHYSDHHYRSPRQFHFAPGRIRDDSYINGYRGWYTRKRFNSGLRVFTRGDV